MSRVFFFNLLLIASLLLAISPIHSKASSAQVKNLKQVKIKQLNRNQQRRTQAIKPKPKTNKEAKCDASIMTMYTSSINGLTPKAVPESITWCDGISENSCCTPDMFTSLKSFWESDIDPKDKQNKLRQHDINMNHVLRHKFRQVTDNAKEVLKEGKTLDPKDQVSIEKLAHTMFTENDYADLQSRSKTCWSFLANLTKGNYCLACDVNEGRIRFQDPKKWRISLQDLHEYSLNCGPYIQIFNGFIEYVRDVQVLIKIKQPNFTFREPPKAMDIDDLRLLFSKNWNCGQDVKKCQSNVLLKQYYVGLMTRVEMDYFNYIEDMAKGCVANFHNPKYLESEEKEMIEQMKSELKAEKAVGRRLANKDTRRKLYPQYTLAKKGLSQLWQEYDKATAVEFDIDETLTKSALQADTKLPQLDMSGFQLFRTSKRCPLAAVFGGEVRVKLNRRIGQANAKERGLCLMLEDSCCTETTFVNYRDMWGEGIINLQIYYKFIEDIKEFFLTKFPYLGVQKRPKVVCKTEKSKPECMKRWKHLHAMTKRATKILPQYLENYRKCIKTINDVRSKMFCFSCDITSKRFINKDRREVIVATDQFKQFVDNCWEYPTLEFEYMSPVFKAYFDYTMLVAPGSDLDLTATEENIFIIKKESKACKAYVDAQKKANKKVDLMSNPDCHKVAEFFTTWVFFMPHHIKIGPAYYRFMRNIVKNIGTNKGMEYLYKIVPTAIITKGQMEKMLAHGMHAKKKTTTRILAQKQMLKKSAKQQQERRLQTTPKKSEKEEKADIESYKKTEETDDGTHFKKAKVGETLDHYVKVRWSINYDHDEKKHREARAKAEAEKQDAAGTNERRQQEANALDKDEAKSGAEEKKLENEEKKLESELPTYLDLNIFKDHGFQPFAFGANLMWVLAAGQIILFNLLVNY